MPGNAGSKSLSTSTAVGAGEKLAILGARNILLANALGCLVRIVRVRIKGDIMTIWPSKKCYVAKSFWLHHKFSLKVSS